MKLRRFTQHDWYGYAGAERPDEKTEPLIGDIHVDGAYCVVIVDKTHVEISHAYSDGRVTFWVREMPFEDGRLLMEHVEDYVTETVLTLIGFSKGG